MTKALDLGRLLGGAYQLPSGSIESLAASKLSGRVPLANVPNGSVIAATSFSSNTMIAVSASSNLEYYSFNITKKSSTSVLIVHGSIPVGGSTNHGIYWFVGFNGNRIFRGIADGWRWHGSTVSENSNPGGIHMNVVSQTGIAAGTVTISMGIQPADGGANLPYQRINPNSSIDSRMNCGTNLIVYEVEA
jgi:hypothetical protein